MRSLFVAVLGIASLGFTTPQIADRHLTIESTSPDRQVAFAISFGAGTPGHLSSDSMVTNSGRLLAWTPARLTLPAGASVTLISQASGLALQATIVDSLAGTRTHMWGGTLRFENAINRGLVLLQADSGMTRSLSQ